MTKNSKPRGTSIQRGKHLSAQGKDDQAFDVMQTHLRKFPKDLDALNLAGTLAARMLDWPQAEQLFTRSLTLDPDNVYALYSLSKVFKLSNRTADAVVALTRLLKTDPSNVPALNELGVLLAEQGHLDPALKAFETAIELDPKFEKAYRNLYAALYTGGCYEAAAEIAQRAIEHIASDYRWHFRTDRILCLWKIKAFEEARQLAEEVIKELEPSDNPSHQEILLHAITNYGVILIEMDEPDAAEAQFKKAIALAPNKVEPYINIAKLNAYREDFQGAIEWFEKALAIDPEHAELHNHLAIFLRNCARADLALPHQMIAAERSPANVEMRFNLSMTQLALGQLDKAFSDWELRWSRREGGVKSTLPIPEWKGVPETGRSILVYREQGIGDEVLFATCLPDLIARFERVVCVCHSKLQPLFARSFPQIEFHSRASGLPEAEIAKLDWQIAIGSLPPLFRRHIKAFPTHPQLLIADPLKVKEICSELALEPSALTIGVAWRSGLLSLDRKAEYPYLKFWQAIFAIPGITWVNIQYGDVSDELREAEQSFGVAIRNFSDIDHFDDLDSSAALMKACDLIIGPGTATTMISAAVGVPTIRLSGDGDCFQLGTGYYPWLPSLTPVPRHFGESWLGPIERTAAIIRTLAAERGGQKTNRAPI